MLLSQELPNLVFFVDIDVDVSSAAGSWRGHVAVADVMDRVVVVSLAAPRTSRAFSDVMPGRPAADSLLVLRNALTRGLRGCVAGRDDWPAVDTSVLGWNTLDASRRYYTLRTIAPFGI